MVIVCSNILYPRISIEQLSAYLEDRIDFNNEDLELDRRRINQWIDGPSHTATKATNATGFIARSKMELIAASQDLQGDIAARISPLLFLKDYSDSLTRLDGSRSGPVFLLDNAFAIADCLAAGRLNNAQVLRDQAVQLLDQRAYKAQELYAEDLERQKDPENYVYVIPQRLFVFVHELMGQRAGQEKQPWGKWDIIGDKEYIAAARAVYTQDMDKAAQVLCNLCNLHVQYSNPFPSGDNDDRLMGVEFDNPVRSLWPTEIFAWLRLRHERGLALPQVEHPLLDQPLGRFDPSATPRPDYEAWFTQLVGKLVEFNPRYADLPQLVFDNP